VRERYGFVVHKEKSIEMDYIMTKENLREINLIRTCLRSFYLQLKQKNTELSMNVHKNVFDKIIKLLNTKRQRFLPRERWMDLFEKDRQEYLHLLPLFQGVLVHSFQVGRVVYFLVSPVLVLLIPPARKTIMSVQDNLTQR
jgi:hypothetical protein